MSRADGKAILLSREGCGGEDTDLGYEILARLLEALNSREDRPAAVICWNTAVRLLEKGSPLAAGFKALEEKGVAVLAGKLCVSELELTGRLAAGKEATISEILDVIMRCEVVSL